MLILKGLRESRKWRMEDGKWQVREGAQAERRGDGEVAGKGGAPFSAALKDERSITQKVLAVNVYLVCNSNECGRC